MQISFFEEFPNFKTLGKLDLIKFPAKLYLEEYSVEGYKQYKKELYPISIYNPDQFLNIKNFILS